MTATLPGNVDVNLAASHFQRHARALAPLDNRHVAAQIEPGDRYLLTTPGHCDCTTPLGAAARSRSRAAGHRAASSSALAQLRRRGWSAAKIERWLDQKDQAGARRADQEGSLAQRDDLDQWIALLHGLVDSGVTARVGLLLHWYRGDLRTERIAIADRHRVRIGEATGERLLGMAEDTLYTFVA